LSNQIYLYLSSISLSDVVNRRVLGTSGVIPGRAVPTLEAPRLGVAE
jgi:Rrf2 family iron-sulfur cluster assembly transcriptional regulator